MPVTIEKMEVEQLAAMSVAEKIRLLESIWDSLCSTPLDVRSPEWHREILEDRQRRLDSGQTSRSSWQDAKARLLELGR